MNAFKMSLTGNVVAASILMLALCAANLPAQTASDIIKRVDENGTTITARVTYSMSIQPSDGSAPREFSLTSSENDKGDSLVEFASPKTVRGMKILSVDGSSWVFFPSTGRTRKIAGSSRSGSVQGVGGDFSYDDLGGDPWAEGYSFTLQSSDAETWTLAGERASGDSAYDRVTLTVDKRLYLPSRIEFSLEKEGGFFKVLELSDFTDYSGRVRARSMTMKNVKKGSSTNVAIERAEFDVPLDGNLFDPVRFSR